VDVTPEYGTYTLGFGRAIASAAAACLRSIFDCARLSRSQ
jgi:hypothetical protein